MAAVTRRVPLAVLISVGLVAGSALALQVVLTRLFSAALFYHFAYMSISLALLGAGSGAIMVYVRPAWFTTATRTLLCRWSVGLAVALIVVPAVLVRLDYDFPGFHVTRTFVATLGMAAILASVPFFIAGVVITVAIRDYVGSVGRVYACDLAGAGVGALVVVPLMWLIDVPTLLVALAAVAGVGASLFAGPERRDLAIGGGALALALLATALAAGTSVYDLPARFGGQAPTADTWTPISRVAGYPPWNGRTAAVVYDQDVAPVPSHSPGGPLPTWRSLGLAPQSIAFATAPHGRALVIGGGGGRDIYNALTSGQRNVDVIELNRAIRSTVDGPLARWSGSPYTMPHVRSAIGDGRSTLAARDTRYDVINLGFTNTLTAGGAQVLSENSLYTTEAVNEYLDHLVPGGILSVSRLYRFAGEEALRATVLALQALRDRGVADPGDHVVVSLSRDALDEEFGTVLVKREPFTQRQIGEIKRLSAQRGARIVWAPNGPYAGEWSTLRRAASLESFCSSYRVDVCAPTDDKPFFLNPARIGDLFNAAPPGETFIARTPYVVLLVTLAILLAIGAAAIALPLLLQRRADRPPVSSLLFFGAIGLGFLMLEVVLIQRFVLFLGFPTYALSVVLFSLLLFTGAGAALSSRWRHPRVALTVALGLAVVSILSAGYWLQPLLRAALGLPFPWRIAMTVALLGPFGLTLGMAMPLGLRRLAALSPAGVPWAWGINGIASVVGAVLAIAVAISWGFSVTTWLAGVCYAAALAHVVLGRWPATMRGADGLAAKEAEVSPVAEPAVGAGSAAP